MLLLPPARGDRCQSLFAKVRCHSRWVVRAAPAVTLDLTSGPTPPPCPSCPARLAGPLLDGTSRSEVGDLMLVLAAVGAGRGVTLALRLVRRHRRLHGLRPPEEHARARRVLLHDL